MACDDGSVMAMRLRVNVRSGDDLIEAGEGAIRCGTKTFSVAVGEIGSEDEAGAYGRDVVDGGTPGGQIMQPGEDRRDLDRGLKQEEHQGKKLEREDIELAGADGASGEDEGDSGERRPKRCKGDPVRDDAREAMQADEVKYAEQDGRHSEHPAGGDGCALLHEG